MPADPQESSAPLAEISQGPNAFEQFLDRNQKNITIFAILVAIGTAVFVVYRGIEKSRQETAGAALNKADDLPSLQAVINDHSGTIAARSAMVLLADRQWTDGQQDNAIATLRKFIAENPTHPAVSTAQASLGSKLMTQGKTPEAAKIFQDLIDDPKARFIAPYALISLGDISRMAGDLEKAEASYKRVKSEFSESGFLDSANRRIATLKAKAPVEIAPPPTPKPETPPATNAPGTINISPKTPGTIDISPTPPPAATPPAEPPAQTPAQEITPKPGNESKPAAPPAPPTP